MVSGWVRVGGVLGWVVWMGCLGWGGRPGRGWLGFVQIGVLAAWVGLCGWWGGMLVGSSRPGIEGKLERGGFFVKEAEAGGVAGSDRSHVVIEEGVVTGDSRYDLARGVPLGGFAGLDCICDAGFPGIELGADTGVDVSLEGCFAKLVDLMADIGLDRGRDGCFEVVDGGGLAVKLGFEVIEMDGHDG